MPKYLNKLIRKIGIVVDILFLNYLCMYIDIECRQLILVLLLAKL